MKLSITYNSNVLVFSPCHFLSVAGERITQKYLYPEFGSALYAPYEAQQNRQQNRFDSLPIRVLDLECIIYLNWGDSTWGACPSVYVASASTCRDDWYKS